MMFEYLIVIYIVYDTNIRLYFYIASDILKNFEFIPRTLIYIYLNTNQINPKQVIQKS